MLQPVRMELARCHDFPDGSSSHGYELRLPLTPDRKLDPKLWREHRHEASFSRFWCGEIERGELRHRAYGWTLSFFMPGFGDDEVIFRADDHRFSIGEYLSIKERDGITRTFRIAAVS